MNKGFQRTVNKMYLRKKIFHTLIPSHSHTCFSFFPNFYSYLTKTLLHISNITTTLPHFHTSTLYLSVQSIVNRIPDSFQKQTLCRYIEIHLRRIPELKISSNCAIVKSPLPTSNIVPVRPLTIPLKNRFARIL